MSHKTLAILKENRFVFAVCINPGGSMASFIPGLNTNKFVYSFQPIKFRAYQNQESKTGVTYLFTFLI